MDRPLDPGFLRRLRARRVIVAAGLLASALFVLGWAPAWLRPSVRRDLIRTARVDAGPLEAVITASGMVLPEIEQVVSSPIAARVLRLLRRPGDTLAKGDAILELDLSASVLAVEKLGQDLALKANQQEKTRLDLAARLSDLDSQREVQRLQAEAARAQLIRHHHLYEQGLLSQETLSQSELAAAQAAVMLRKLEREAAHARASTDTQIQGLALETATLRRELDEARRQLAVATTRADRDGVLTWALSEEGASVRQGDVIARIADLRSFRVDATVSDVHAQKLRSGLPVAVRVNERGVLRGLVVSVHPTIQNGVMTFCVALDEKSSSLLRSNLRVDVLVVTGRKERARRIARGPFADGEGLANVFVVQGERAVKRPVRLGMSSFEHYEVLEGLQEGDEVIVSDMGEFDHLKEVRIR